MFVSANVYEWVNGEIVCERDCSKHQTERERERERKSTRDDSTFALRKKPCHANFSGTLIRATRELLMLLLWKDVCRQAGRRHLKKLERQIN